MQNPREYDVELLKLPELIIAQSKDTFWEQSRQPVGIPDSAFTFDRNKVHVRKALSLGSYKCLCQHH